MNKREFAAPELKQVSGLIKAECCNFDKGHCMLLFDGDERTCPQCISLHLCCKWFEEAVLPLDGILQKQLTSEDYDFKSDTCDLCGKEIVKTGNRQRYCSSCQKKMRRKYKSEYMSKKRTTKVEL